MSKVEQAKGINLVDKDLISAAKSPKGVICPSCNRKIKAYKRKITPSMAIALVEIYKYYKYAENVEETDYFTAEDVFFRLSENMYSDYTMLYYWDLIEPQGSHPTKFIKKRGSWRITENGIKFCQLEIGLPDYALIYNGEVSEHSTNPIMLDDILSGIGVKLNDLINLKE